MISVVRAISVEPWLWVRATFKLVEFLAATMSCNCDTCNKLAARLYDGMQGIHP